MVTPMDYGCYRARAQVALCAPGANYLPEYWWSRYPAKVPPTWNVVKLFDPPSWTLIFTSIIFVTIFFFIAARVGTSYFGIRTVHEEIVLTPFR